MSAPTPEQSRQAAVDALERGDLHEAFRHYRFVLARTDPACTVDQWRDAFALFARISTGIAGAEFASYINQTIDDPDDVQALYDLGYQLIEQSVFDIAAVPLARANRLHPGQEGIVCELVVALESDMRCHEAARVLNESPALLERSFTCRYLLAYNALMTGDRAEPRRLLPSLQGPGDANQVFMARRIEGMLTRADAVEGVTTLDDHDLRGWHFVITGGLLLYLSPYGLDEPMHGRYAFVQDNVAVCLEGLRRLAAVLEAWNIRPPRVWRVDEPDSAALAYAAAEILGCPLVAWPAAGSNEAGLVPVYDVANLPEPIVVALREHRPGQVLWTQAACWTTEPPFAADLVTFLHQINVSPWGERRRVDPETKQMVKDPPSTAPPAERAKQVLEAPLEPDALTDLPALLELARSAARVTGEHGPGALRVDGLRRRQGTNSPVPSNRFV